MVRRTIRQTIGAAALAALLPLLCVSCSEDGTDPTGGGDDGGTFPIGMTIRAAALDDNDGTYYVRGTGYENYIDMASNDCRIYFFENTGTDVDETLITEFTPDIVVPIEGTDYTRYNVQGSISEDKISSLGSFKVVILANWGANNYPEVEEGTTTISQLCEDSYGKGQYTHLTDFDLSPSNLIPFYGVHTYEDVSFKANVATVLEEPVTLLRAMAKVEVVLEDSHYTTLDNVKIHRYNDKGYCAPKGVYSEDSYDHYDTTVEGKWAKDYVSALHLVDGANSEDNDDWELPFLKAQEYAEDLENADNTTYETWIAYVPEYDNTGDDYSYIEVVLEGISYKLYFAEYVDGSTDAYKNDGTCERYDLHRNNLYRFTVSMGISNVNVHVSKWDDEYTNKFEFGVSGGSGD